MTLYDQCVDLQVKLEAAHAADAGLELLARGQRLVEALEAARNYLAQAAQLPAELRSGSSPALDDKSVNQAIGAFRGGLSRHGVVAFQHQPAATLVDVAKAHRDKCARWVDARWRGVFTPYEEDVERAGGGRLVGELSQRLSAQRRASTLRTARGYDPIEHRGDLERLLGGQGIKDWLRAIRTLGDELHAALARLDAARNAMTPEVRDALHRATSEGGLAFSDLTTELLAAIRAAGVDDQLVVRHQ